MASFSPVRGTRSQIQSTAITDGQLLFETDQGNDGKIYLDIGTTSRITIGGGSSALSSLGDVNLSSPSNNQVLQYNSSNSKWTNATLNFDDWVTYNGSVVNPTLATGTTNVTFTASQLADVINNGYAIQPFIDCAIGQDNGEPIVPPNLVKIVENVDHSITVYYTEVTSAQAGLSGDSCKMKLRVLK